MENINLLEDIFGHMNRNELKEKINKAKFAYYNTDTPIISDKEYDQLIKEYGFEPSVGAPVLEKIEKINISDRPMLSLDKVHSLNEIETFANKKNLIATIKCDGLSVRLIYENGQLIGANTRGDGKIGGNIFSHAHYIKNIPLTIPTKIRTLIDGEVIIFEKDFDKNKFKNQRNAAAGGLSLLNMQEVKDRKMSFVAWDIFTKENIYTYYTEKLKDIESFGFDVVPSIATTDYQLAIDFCLKAAKEKGCPCDGVVFKFNDIQYGESLGSTEHHFKNAIAWKNYDETYPTRLRYIDWTMGRTGVLTPVAVFDPIEIDGAEVSRASLHNVSVMRETLGDCAYVGEHLEVFKSNMIIPQIYSAGPKYNYGEVISKGGVSANDSPEFCPICHGEIAFKEENGVERAYCENPLCSGKLINRLDHFCGKKGLDIKGLSKKTLEKLIDWGWINSLEDIFKLQEHRNEWIEKEGFGIASVDKILTAIEEGKNCTASKFIAAIGIPQIGKVASEDLIKVYHTYNGFRHAVDFPDEDDRLYNIKGIGEVMIKILTTFNYTEADNIFDNHIIEIISSVPEEDKEEDKKLKDKIFVITGKTIKFKNRNELKDFIENNGGKVTGSVSKKTNYLVNNDVNSTSSKNKMAKELNIPIITEQELIDLIN